MVTSYLSAICWGPRPFLAAATSSGRASSSVPPKFVAYSSSSGWHVRKGTPLISRTSVSSCPSKRCDSSGAMSLARRPELRSGLVPAELRSTAHLPTTCPQGHPLDQPTAGSRSARSRPCCSGRWRCRCRMLQRRADQATGWRCTSCPRPDALRREHPRRRGLHSRGVMLRGAADSAAFSVLGFGRGGRTHAVLRRRVRVLRRRGSGRRGVVR
jgi:hypothetical protein